MTYAYIRYSTDNQEDTQQIQALKEYTDPRGITIDAIVRDEGVSGGVSYKDRNLYELVQQLQQGDNLIVSEISRLGRSMSDLNLLVNEELKPRGVRLIVVKMGIDLDCANIRAVDEMLLHAFAFAAQLEKELIQQRTQSALDARKGLIAKEGGFFSKSGRWCTKLGPAKLGDITGAQIAGARVMADRAQEWRQQSPLYLWVQLQFARNRSRQDILADAAKLYRQDPKKYGTPKGKQLTKGTLSVWAREIENML